MKTVRILRANLNYLVFDFTKYNFANIKMKNSHNALFESKLKAEDAGIISYCDIEQSSYRRDRPLQKAFILIKIFPF